jgi:hypothetical protein
MGGALIATGFHPGNLGVTSCGFGAGDEGTPFAEQRGTLAGEPEVRLAMRCGTVTVTPVDGDGWSLSGSSDDGRPPAVQRSERRVEVIAPDRVGVGIAAAASTWRVALPRAGAMDLALSVDAGSGDLDLAGMTVQSIEASVNAGEARIDLSGTRGVSDIQASVNAGSLVLLLPVPGTTVGGEISVNAGSASICAPDGVALRFRTDESLGSVNFGDRGLVQNGDTWSTPGYDGAADPRFDLALSANLGSITLDPEDGCD